MSDGFFPAYAPAVDVFPSSSLITRSDNTCYRSTVFDNSVIRAADVRLMFRGQVSGTPIVGGFLDLYLTVGMTLTAGMFTDGIDPTAAVGASVSAPMYSRHIANIPVANSAGTSFSWEGSILEYVSAMPVMWAIVVCNRTGVTTSSTAANNTFHATFVNYGYA